jgi:sugar phosphate isomerase/epimerase
MRHDQIALQLYTVRRLMADDLPGTLRAVAAAGYRNVELAGIPDDWWRGLPAALADAGLHAVGAHEGIDRLRADPTAVADRLAAAGCQRVIVPWMPPADRGTVADVQRFAAELGALAEQFTARGMAFGYHNHDFEFAPVEGTTAWDVLRTELPATVDLEVDVYWVSVAGLDPVTVLRSVAGRLRLLHMKDRAPGTAIHDAPVGSGILDMPGIVEAGRSADVDWYVVEQDEPGDAIAEITASAVYLESLAG